MPPCIGDSIPNRQINCQETSMKRILCSAATVIAITSAAYLPTQAIAQVNYKVVVVSNAPPAARYEAVPRARRGYEWSPGYWNWNGKTHRWTKGHWERTRKGHYYQRAEWQQTSDGWRLRRGGWQAGDRDGDGVPNRQDRQPNNPNRS